jgi:hypothetical protein
LTWGGKARNAIRPRRRPLSRAIAVPPQSGAAQGAGERRLVPIEVFATGRVDRGFDTLKYFEIWSNFRRAGHYTGGAKGQTEAGQSSITGVTPAPGQSPDWPAGLGCEVPITTSSVKLPSRYKNALGTYLVRGYQISVVYPNIDDPNAEGYVPNFRAPIEFRLLLFQKNRWNQVGIGVVDPKHKEFVMFTSGGEVPLHYKVMVNVQGAGPQFAGVFSVALADIAVQVWEFENPQCPIDPTTKEPLDVCTTWAPI